MMMSPYHTNGYSNLGGLLEALKQYDEAEEALRTAVILGRQDSTATKVIETYTFLVNSVVLRKGAVTTRYQDGEQAIAAYPQLAVPYGWKGTVLYRMGRVKEATEMLETAVRSNVAVAEMHYYLGLCYLEGGKDGRRAAGEMFRKTLQLDPTHSGARKELGKMK